ncbi:MAG: hypothetical protein HXS53_00320 [Theionarchaea archaeon]|nr:hypothetical protein [Theionarchaea archaeon]
MTGEKGVGKTTLLKKVVDAMGTHCYGVISERNEKGYAVTDVKTGETRILCSTDPIGIKVRGYYFDLHALSFIEESLRRGGDLLVYDEIGWLETQTDFHILPYLKDKALLIVRKELVDEFSKAFAPLIFEVTEENRDKLLDRIVAELSYIIP